MSDWDSLYFPIPYEYKPLFTRLAASCRVLLERSDLKSGQRCMLEKLHFTLLRLPVLTLDVDYIVILANPHHDEFDRWGTYTIEINQNFFRLTNAFYLDSVTSEDHSRTRLVLHCENNGYRYNYGEEDYLNYTIFEGWICGWESLCRNLNSRLIVYNEQEAFDWHQYHDPLAWEKMLSLFS